MLDKTVEAICMACAAAAMVYAFVSGESQFDFMTYCFVLATYARVSRTPHRPEGQE